MKATAQDYRHENNREYFERLVRNQCNRLIESRNLEEFYERKVAHEQFITQWWIAQQRGMDI